MARYELVILGTFIPAERARLTQTITDMVSAFELTVGSDVMLRDGTTVGARDIHAATAAVYFGGAPEIDAAAARDLVRASLPVIPTVATSADFSTTIPDFLQGFNGLRRRADDSEMTELAAAMLECVGLLRRQRRVFVSYRRVESRAAALQLHDFLTARGFDVFLDTHDIRPGDPFQRRALAPPLRLRRYGDAGHSDLLR